MISDELKSEIRRLFYVRHFTANAIASSLGIHRDTVMKAIELREAERIASESELDRFEGKIKETLQIYPKLQGTRIHQMLKEQGYTGSLRHLRRRLRSLSAVKRGATRTISTHGGLRLGLAKRNRSSSGRKPFHA